MGLYLIYLFPADAPPACKVTLSATSPQQQSWAQGTEYDIWYAATTIASMCWWQKKSGIAVRLGRRIPYNQSNHSPCFPLLARCGRAAAATKFRLSYLVFRIKRRDDIDAGSCWWWDKAGGNELVYGGGKFDDGG